MFLYGISTQVFFHTVKVLLFIYTGILCTVIVLQSIYTGILCTVIVLQSIYTGILHTVVVLQSNDTDIFYTVVVFELEVTNELFIPETKIKKTLLYLIIVMWCNFSIPYGQEQLDGHHAGMASTGKAFFHCKAWKIFL